jgi:hypothetical protein
MILRSNVVTYYKTKPDMQAENMPAGSFMTDGMRLEADTGRCEGPDGLMASFAITPANITANQGHVRRIVCGCDSLEERQRWTDSLTLASKGLRLQGSTNARGHNESAMIRELPAQRKLRTLSSDASSNRILVTEMAGGEQGGQQGVDSFVRPLAMRSASYHGESSGAVSATASLAALSPMESVASPGEGGQMYLRLQAWMAKESSKRELFEREMLDARTKQDQQLDKIEALLSVILLKMDASDKTVKTCLDRLSAGSPEATPNAALGSVSANLNGATAHIATIPTSDRDQTRGFVAPCHGAAAARALPSRTMSYPHPPQQDGSSCLPKTSEPSPRQSQGTGHSAGGPPEKETSDACGDKSVDESIAESIIGDILFAQQHMNETSSFADTAVATVAFSTEPLEKGAQQAGRGVGDRRQQQMDEAALEMEAASAAFDSLRQKIRSLSDS